MMFPITKILGGGLIAVGFLLAVQTYRVSSLKSDLHTAELELTAEKNAHAVTRQSVATLEADAKRFIEDGRAREAAASEALERAIEASRGNIAAAARLADRAPSGRCSSEHLKGIGL